MYFKDSFPASFIKCGFHNPDMMDCRQRGGDSYLFQREERKVGPYLAIWLLPCFSTITNGHRLLY